MKVLVLTAGYGEGHNAAARALAAAAETLGGAGSAEVVDVFELARPRLSRISRRAYLSLISRAPALWRGVYHRLDRSPRAAAAIARLLPRETALLGSIVRAARPAAICSTYPLYGFLLNRLRAAGLALPPFHTVVTDSISIHSLWWRAGGEGWFVPNTLSADVLVRAGVEPARVHALGFPVAEAFAGEAAAARLPALHAGARPRVLYIINSRSRAAVETAHALLSNDAWDVTCTVGRNETLRTELMRLAADRRRSTPILGWTEEIPRLLATHHVVVSKAGGATTQEAIAARCPMVVSQIVPGQEEGNCELLRRHGIGAYAPTPGCVIDELTRAFADQGRIWGEWRKAASRLARPHAALNIAAAVMGSPVPGVSYRDRAPGPA